MKQHPALKKKKNIKSKCAALGIFLFFVPYTRINHFTFHPTTHSSNMYYIRKYIKTVNSYRCGNAVWPHLLWNFFIQNKIFNSTNVGRRLSVTGGSTIRNGTFASATYCCAFNLFSFYITKILFKFLQTFNFTN